MRDMTKFQDIFYTFVVSYNEQIPMVVFLQTVLYLNKFYRQKKRVKRASLILVLHCIQFAMVIGELWLHASYLKQLFCWYYLWVFVWEISYQHVDMHL